MHSYSRTKSQLNVVFVRIQDLFASEESLPKKPAPSAIVAIDLLVGQFFSDFGHDVSNSESS